MSRRYILLVDDDVSVLETVERGLRRDGHRTRAVTDGTSALRAINADPPDAVVLEVGLPDLSGRVIAARLRAGGVRTPILALSSQEAVVDRVAGLEAGADDYLVKPFSMEELCARIRALLRRAAASAEEDPTGLRPPAGLGALRVDVDASVASWDGRSLHLTGRELTLLYSLVTNPDVVMTRERLQQLVWGEADPDSRALDVFVAYLRRKLAEAGAPPLIKTVRGVGFRICPSWAPSARFSPPPR